MLQEREQLVIPIPSEYGQVILRIVPSSKKGKLYQEDMPEPDETVYQLEEGSVYQYAFDPIGHFNFQFVEENEIVRASSFRNHQNRGAIFTGIYVGQLSLPVCEIDSQEIVGKVNLEIRSVKTDNERDCRQMLDDIAEFYTEPISAKAAGTTGKKEVDEDCSSQNLYRKFSFIRSMVESASFQASVYTIMANPVRRWAETRILSDVTSVRRLSGHNFRKIATERARLPFTEAFRTGLTDKLTNVPRKMEMNDKRETVDNPENQFVKFVLVSFVRFCTDLREKRNATEKLRKDTEKLVDQLSAYLESAFFRQVALPAHLNLNSPVLRHKDGYREMFQAWLLFDFAARLNWSVSGSVYKADKKNVAILYEYWLFFKLRKLIDEFFVLEPTDSSHWTQPGEERSGFPEILGRTTLFRGKSRSGERPLNLAFYYNRTLNTATDTHGFSRESDGWSMSMRPDYSLSIWPGELEEQEAEKQDKLTHIHFYQETESRVIQGFHEIIPGLGVFCVRPGHWDTDAVCLREFLAALPQKNSHAPANMEAGT